jgi:signal transduction histidine kinase
MRSRTAEIGGRIAITSAPGSGTVVRVCVPV